MGEKKDQLESQGVQLIVVGSGAPSYVEEFRKSIGTTFSVYSDPTLQVFQALSFERGLLSALKPQAWKRGLEAFRSGFRQGRVQGDAQQLGGMLAVSRSGDTLYTYRSQFAGDHPPLEEALAAFPG